MAYVIFDPTDTASSIASTKASDGAACARSVRPRFARFDPLEWTVVVLARRDSLATLRAPGRFSALLRAVFRQRNPRLADERLEALRRMSVLAWNHSFQVPTSEIRAFFDAGFSVGHYEALMAGIVDIRRQEGMRR